jgi:hypothetical protein
MHVPFAIPVAGAGMSRGAYPTQFFLPVAAPHEREILVSSSDGSGVRWRACHNLCYANIYPPATVANFTDGCFANMSRDGRYILFGSNMHNTLGLTPQRNYRNDCFIVELT